MTDDHEGHDAHAAALLEQVAEAPLAAALEDLACLDGQGVERDGAAGCAEPDHTSGARTHRLQLEGPAGARGGGADDGQLFAACAHDGPRTRPQERTLMGMWMWGLPSATLPCWYVRRMRGGSSEDNTADGFLNLALSLDGEMRRS